VVHSKQNLSRGENPSLNHPFPYKVCYTLHIHADALLYSEPCCHAFMYMLLSLTLRKSETDVKVHVPIGHSTKYQQHIKLLILRCWYLILFSQHRNNFKCKISKLPICRSIWVLQFWYKRCLHLTTYKKYISFLIRQLKYVIIMLLNIYIFFEHLNVVK